MRRGPASVSRLGCTTARMRHAASVGFPVCRAIKAELTQFAYLILIHGGHDATRVSLDDFVETLKTASFTAAFLL